MCLSYFHQIVHLHELSKNNELRSCGYFCLCPMRLEVQIITNITPIPFVVNKKYTLNWVQLFHIVQVTKKLVWKYIDAISAFFSGDNFIYRRRSTIWSETSITCRLWVRMQMPQVLTRASLASHSIWNLSHWWSLKQAGQTKISFFCFEQLYINVSRNVAIVLSIVLTLLA